MTLPVIKHLHIHLLPPLHFFFSMYILHRRDLRRCSGFMMNKPLSRCSKASGESGSTSAPQRPLPALASSCTSPSSMERSSNSTLPKWVSGKGFGKEQPGGNSGKDHYLFTCTFKVLWKSTPQKELDKELKVLTWPQYSPHPNLI